ncbi:hypothetical protein L9F63_023098, partial [Diploptera punctata]
TILGFNILIIFFFSLTATVEVSVKAGNLRHQIFALLRNVKLLTTYVQTYFFLFLFSLNDIWNIKMTLNYFILCFNIFKSFQSAFNFVGDWITFEFVMAILLLIDHLQPSKLHYLIVLDM